MKLRLAVALYTFFPLVTELAKEIAASLSLDHSQVRIMGANSASPQLEKTTVLINLVPRGAKFGNDSAFAIYKKFFHKQVQMEASQFGDYEVLYVHYPGIVIVTSECYLKMISGRYVNAYSLLHMSLFLEFSYSFTIVYCMAQG